MRRTACLLLLLSWSCSQSSGPPGPGATPQPTPSERGTSLGPMLTQTIGASGGSVSSADGRLTLTFPAGALAEDTEIGIEPITNTAPLGIGNAYRLTPDEAKFPQPITVTFSYQPSDLPGSSSDALFCGYQSSDGLWHTLGSPTVDTTAQTVSNPQGHFTDVSLLMGWQLDPGEATVAPFESLQLRLKVCQPDTFSMQDDELAALTYRCDLEDADLPQLVNVTGWSVNGVRGGGIIDGTVSGLGRFGTYQAPYDPPPQNPVAVSVEFTQGKGNTLAVSNVTVGMSGWTGTFSWTLMGDQSMGDGTTMDVYSVSGSGMLTLKPGGGGLGTIGSATATYHYMWTQHINKTTNDGICTRTLVQTQTQTLDGMSTDTMTAGLYVVDDGTGMASVSASFPQGPTQGTLMLDATETDTGSGPSCTSTHQQMTTPTDGQMPYDTPMFMAPIVNGVVKGNTMFTVDGTPPHQYSVTYNFSDH